MMRWEGGEKGEMIDVAILLLFSSFLWVLFVSLSLSSFFLGGFLARISNRNGKFGTGSQRLGGRAGGRAGGCL